MEIEDGGNAPDRVQQRSFLWSIVGLAMLVLVGLIALWTLRQVNDSDRWVDHTREVINSAEHALADLKEAESAERGYMLIGLEEYLEPYNRAVQDLPKAIANLRQLTSDNPHQQARLDELDPLVASKLAAMAEAIRRRKELGFKAALGFQMEAHGEETMARIYQIGRDLQRDEYGMLRQRLDLRQSRMRGGLIATLLASAIAVLSLVIAPFDVRRAVRQRDLALRAQIESQSMTHALFEAAAEAIFIVDRQGRIVMTNPAAARMFRFPPAELVGMTVEALVPESLRHRHVDHREGYFGHPTTRPMGLGLDLQARRRDGTEFYAEISLSHIQTQQGAFAVVFITDISKRRAYRDAVMVQQQELRMLAGRLMTAQDDERRRIARNLHDDLTQRLAFLAIDLGKLAGEAPFPEAAARLRPLQQRAADAAENVRQISHQLHPSILDDIGLEGALEQYCEDFSERTGIATHFRSRGVPERLAPDIASSVYRIAQESLRNVSKHAQAKEAWVTVEALDGELNLTIHDNGIGMSPESTNSGTRIGIASMQERAHLVKGKLSINSEHGEGTQVRVVVPLSLEKEAG